MLLTTPDAPLPEALVDYLRASSEVDRALLFGGTVVLGDDVAYSVARLASA